MKRFRFRLARLERLRGHAEKVARRELGERLSLVGRIEADLRTIEENLETCRSSDERGRALGEALESGLTSLRARRMREREDAVAEAEIARAVYTERRRELLTLRNLHERKHEAWREETARAEQAELDELARLRAAGGER